jgi:hypothetical protein
MIFEDTESSDPWKVRQVFYDDRQERVKKIINHMDQCAFLPGRSRPLHCFPSGIALEIKFL